MLSRSLPKSYLVLLSLVEQIRLVTLSGTLAKFQLDFSIEFHHCALATDHPRAVGSLMRVAKYGFLRACPDLHHLDSLG
jgi:hypothetical protein